MKTRLKQAFLLTPAFSILAMFVIWISSVCRVPSIEEVVQLLIWGVLSAFCISYSITMYVHEILNDLKKAKE